MRSHVTPSQIVKQAEAVLFQYRKRYEVTCDRKKVLFFTIFSLVSIPQAV